MRVVAPSVTRGRQRALYPASLMVCALLASCGGGGSDSTEPASAEGRATRLSATPPVTFDPGTPIPADASTRGMWSPVYNWPIVPVHMVLLPDGRVLNYGSSTTGAQGAHAIYDVWDSAGSPAAGHNLLPNNAGTDIFCSSSLLLPPGSDTTPASVFIAGGDVWNGSTTTNAANSNSNLFDVTTSTLTRKSDMNQPRWYSTSVTLINGETYIQGGNGGGTTPEIRGLNGVFRSLTGANTSTLDALYPRNFVAPDGRVFGFDSNGAMYYVNPTGLGAMTRAGQLASTYVSWTGSAAMFRPGRILQISGNSNAAAVIDLTSGAPVVTPTQSVLSTRSWGNATLLADGKVLATSGSGQPNALVNVTLQAEIWNPTTGQWLEGPSAVKPRLYHSNAILLPDASVLVSGGGATVTSGTGPADNLNAEIYYPPYLFNAAGQRASRPVIAAAPSWVDIGKVLSVDIENAASVSRVTLVKTGASTHSFNMDQRFIDLTFTSNGLHLNVQAPAHASEATPGFYQLFVFNEAGVPSVSKIVRVGVAPVADPAIAPTLTNPGAQATDTGTPVTLPLSASDPNGDTLTFAASGLPPGLTIDPATGTVAGVPTTAGTYSVSVTASDGVNVASASFVWTVTNPSAVVIGALPQVAPTLVGANAVFTASATNGSHIVYRWNFGDGSALSAWSSSATVSHSFAAAGTYNITLSVSDDSQIVQTRSFLQTIYLPATANKPSASSNLAIETPASGNPRLWVVNQDNDTVSVFDTVTRAKLGEVAVGAAPRTVAVAPNGLVWVTNKRADSISVIDPASRNVVNTIALPRGSQPYGVAMSPAANQAFVVLEATGQLLKFDTTSRAQIGALAVGSQPRHLSVSADGSSVYVSRFITPSLPGESTATVSPTASTGGEVVQLDAATMTVLQTIVLHHSDAPDLENMGRGIPNYLAAATISPDGTQAWVPSKQDNVKRGALRDGNALNFQNTVRAVSSRIVLSSGQEDLAKRVDHDNSSVASAAVYDARGVYLFVALETSREVAVVDAFGGFQVMRFDVGRAPQGLALSPDGTTLFVNNFMDRSVGVYDLRPLLNNGQLSVPAVATLASVGTEALSTNVLLGKQLFYDARDTRLARDRYMSCAACHNDGGSDGRVWDLTSQGEGLRNTIALRGRAGMGHGPLHWSGNFNEVQDFEGQIRTLAGGSGLMSDSAFNTGTRSQPLGDPKAGLSADLDALAAYVSSLSSFEPSPLRGPSGALTATAVAGRSVFLAQNCAQCHGGTAFTNSGSMGLQNIGTIKPSSGQRLGGPLTGIDIPTLRDVWRTGPYLHDGSAATLDAAIAAHAGVSIGATDMASLTEYLREIGADETTAPATAALSAVLTTDTNAVNLTTVGTADWAHWGDSTATAMIRKASGASQISAYTLISGGSASVYTDDLRQLSWTDGAGTVTSTGNIRGVYIAGIGNGFKVTVPASTVPRTVTFYGGGWLTSGTFRAHLSDGSVADYTDTTALSSGPYKVAYAVTYAAASAGQTLTLTWTQTAGTGNMTLNAVALGGPTTPNQPPTITTPAAQTGTQGTATTLGIAASDPDGDALTYSATGLPAGLTINAATGVIGGTPTTAGNSSVVVTVQDGRGGSASASFAWTIQAPANRPPVITAPAAQTSTQGIAATLSVVASDPDGDALTFSASGLPSGLTIAPATGVISGTPTTPGSGTVNVTVQDGRGGSASASFAWTVQMPANHAPTVVTPAAQTGTIGVAQSLAISAADIDGDVLAYSATGLPLGLVIDAGSGLISGTPLATGTSTTVVTVQDGRGGAATATFGWVIKAANNPPVITTPAAQNGTQGQAASLAISASDVDGDALSYSATGLPTGLSINAGTGAISGTPSTVGTFSVVVTVSDGRGGSASASFAWSIAAPGPGTLSGAVSTSTAVVNLTTTGTLDWAHWGGTTGTVPGLVRKASGGSQIGTYTLIAGGTASGYTGDPRGLTWTDGTPTASSTQNTTGVYKAGIGNGFSLTIPAGTTSRTVTVHLGGWQSAATFRAHLSDSSAPDFVDTLTTVAPDSYQRSYTITFAAASASKQLVLTWTQTAGGGNVTLNGATFAGPNQPPIVTTPAAQTSTRSVATTLNIAASDPDGDTLSYSATGLPAGLTINATTGVISGTPTTVATYGVVVTVQDGHGGSASASFAWVIQAPANKPPVITTPPAQSGTQGTASTLAIVASDPDADPLSYSATGLPTGMTINAATGVISGTPSAIGSNSVVVTVQDGRGGSASASFTWTVQAPANKPPVITTPAAQTGTQGVAATLAIAASDPDGDTLTYSATGLPTGLTINAATGVISGTPSAIGSNSVVVTVQDGRGGSASASFTWTVQAPANKPPVITTPAAQTGTQGAAATLAIAASDPDGDTLTYSATGLPAGLAISPTTGVITGTPTTVGANSVVVTVQDGRGGSASASFTWTVQAPANHAPTVVTPAAQAGTVGVAQSLAISAADVDGDALVFGASGLPLGLSINAGSGQISGTPTAAGTSSVTVTVQDGRGGAAAANFSWVVKAANTPPVITTPAAQSGKQGQAASLAISASDIDGDVLTYTATGLPSGLSINAATGAISGTPSAVGAFSVVVTVNDGRGGSASASFAWTIAAAPPGSLSGSVSSSTAVVNLATGTTDWAHWGGTTGTVPGLVRKSGGGSLISAYTLIAGGTASGYIGDPRGLTWTGGTPTASSTNNTTGVYKAGIGNGFSLSVPADTTPRTVTLFVGGWQSAATLRAHLSDGSAVDFVDNTTAVAPDSYQRTYTLTYTAASAAQKLVLTWTQNAGTGNVTLNGATLK